MKIRFRPAVGAFPVIVVLAIVAPIPAAAQIKPASSGQPSFHEPEMRRHGSGFYRPNRPHHHHRHHPHHFAVPHRSFFR